MTYKDIKSEFVKNKLEGLKWNEENRQYIDDLMFLEEYVLGNIHGFSSNKKAHHLKNKYQDEYHAIFKELKPGEYQEYIKKQKVQEQQEAKERKELQRQETKHEQQRKKEWQEMGGKI